MKPSRPQEPVTKFEKSNLTNSEVVNSDRMLWVTGNDYPIGNLEIMKELDMQDKLEKKPSESDDKSGTNYVMTSKRGGEIFDPCRPWSVFNKIHTDIDSSSLELTLK